MAITKVSRGLLSTGVSDSSDATAITIDSGENVGIGTTAIPHGGVGAAKLAIEGGDQNFTTGPHLQMTTASDDHPLMQILPFTHDNVSISFDSYHDGTSWKSSDAGSNFQIYKLSDSLQFRYAAGVSAGSEPTWAGAMNIDSSGNVSIGNGNLIIGTSGKGIDFSANANASGMTSELLDDYEEGAHAATVNMTSGSMTFNMTYNTMSYTKIGNRVFISGYFVCASTANNTTGVANMKWSLPFSCHNAPSSESTVSLAFNGVNIGNASNMWAYIPRNAQRIEFYSTSTSTGALQVSDTAVQGAWDVRFFGQYVTAE